MFKSENLLKNYLNNFNIKFFKIYIYVYILEEKLH
jgi:hypothetical protein